MARLSIEDYNRMEKAKKSYNPIGSKVVFRMHMPPKDTRGNLVLPDASRGEWHTVESTVLAVGPDCLYVREGDVIVVLNEAVLYQTRHPDENNLCLICDENQVLGIVNRAPESAGGIELMKIVP